MAKESPMTTDIYDQHRAAFAQVSAYVIFREGERVATIALKFPRDGAGLLYAYVHWMGEPMVRGWAGGGGYDKRSAACADASRRLPASLSHGAYACGTPHYTEAQRADFKAFRAALGRDDGHDWTRNVVSAGFTVHQAV
jgi:hypothetical protein